MFNKINVITMDINNNPKFFIEANNPGNKQSNNKLDK